MVKRKIAEKRLWMFGNAITTNMSYEMTMNGTTSANTSSTIPCAQAAGQPMGQCEFCVARAGGGYATVVIKKSDGRTRAIFFRMGKPIGADTSQAEGYPEFKATKESDLNIIRIGNERYEIPDAVALGG